MGKKTEPRSIACSQLDRIFAVPMFIVGLAFLLVTGALLHLTQGNLTSTLGLKLLAVLGVLYLAFVVETITHWRAGSKNMRQHVRYLCVPIMRLCPRDHVDGQSAWIPLIGWRRLSPQLEKFLARVFSGPMIVIALLVLPVVAIEFMYAEKLHDSPISKFAIDTCSGFIWMAFVFEFVVMFSIVEKRWRYCRQNWIDVAVVLLPLVSFMGAARLGRLVKLKQLSRTAKIYRMRGLALRTWRAVVALDVIDTLLRRDAEQRMERLRTQIQEKQEEIEHLRKELARIQAKSVPAAEPNEAG
jgi:voltage-gated potassium channel